MDWNDIRFFLTLARTGSLTEAARLLQVSQSTVARRIEALEQALRKPLFIRRQTGYVLNEVGFALLPDAERIESQVTAFEDDARASSQTISGRVRLALPELLGTEFIVPRLGGLRRELPGVSLDIMADVRPLRLSRREADVLVRVVRPEQGDYRMRRAASLALGLYAAPAYAAARGLPRTPEEIAGHDLIGWLPDYDYLTHAGWLLEQAGEQELSMRTSTMAAQFSATLAGLGLSALPAVIAEPAGLIRALQDSPPLILDLWVVTSGETGTLARVQAVAEAVTAMLSHERRALNPFEGA